MFRRQGVLPGAPCSASVDAHAPVHLPETLSSSAPPSAPPAIPGRPQSLPQAFPAQIISVTHLPRTRLHPQALCHSVASQSGLPRSSPSMAGQATCDLAFVCLCHLILCGTQCPPCASLARYELVPECPPPPPLHLQDPQVKLTPSPLCSCPASPALVWK